MGLPIVVKKMAISTVRTVGGSKTLNAERPADRITTNSEARERLINVESPVSIITKGIASIMIEGALNKVLFTPADIWIPRLEIKFN
jgi:hypothetical protein